ncbi:MAG TPA: ATP-binding protein [Ktedonobacterales bacterium]|nr:ATP-binding protein [Ktedonobacterales bacterium]
MNKQLTHWSILLDIIGAAVVKDADKARNYAGLLADRLEEDGEKVMADRIRRKLESAYRTPQTSSGNTASAFTSASLGQAPVDLESRVPFVDELSDATETAPVLDVKAQTEIERFIRLQGLNDALLTKGIPAPRTLLLYGPPGCGKSTAAAYVAQSLHRSLLIVRLDAVISSYLGTTAKNLRSVFEHAARRGGVLFLDELDALAKMRDDSNEVGEIKRIVTSLIQNIDAFPHLYVIAATNHEHLLDPAIWRRFDSIIELKLPDFSQRTQLLHQFLDIKDIDEATTTVLTTLTEGLSGADIKQIAIRSRQEYFLKPTSNISQLLVREIWRRRSAVESRDEDDAGKLVHFIDASTSGKTPAKTIAFLVGINESRATRLRRAQRTEGVVTHG